MAEKVVILGGGVAGMSAAFELLERGYEVEVFERQRIPGGKARSIPVMQGLDDRGSKADHIEAIDAFLAMGGQRPIGQKRPWLPGEHGFRFFPNFYRHITDSMARVPFGSGTTADNLVDTTQVLIACYDKAGIELPSRFPETAAEMVTTLKTFLYAISPRNRIPYADIEHFAGCVWRIVTSCEERRWDEYERIGWWEFIGAEQRSEAYQKFLGIGITRSLVAARATTASTKTIGDIFVQLLFGILTPGVASDRLLNGPTNVVWIQPWLDHMKAMGIRYHFDHAVKEIELSQGRVSAAVVEHQGQTRRVTGDWFIGALPVERMAPLITPAMEAIDPTLANLTPLATNVQWMNGIQYYLTRDVALTHGHIIFIDSPWALTAVSQKQFWPHINFANWGDGLTKGIISVDISQWDKPGFNGKAAIDCTREEIAEETWVQLKRSLNVDGHEWLRDEDLHYWFLDPDIVRDPKDPGRMTSVEPLLVNRVNTWRLRPEADTAIPNFMLASDYVRTFTDLATMEGANEAARRAVNAILDRGGFEGPRCQIWNLHEPEALAPFRAYDRVRYRAGLPWDDRFPTALEASLSLAQDSVGMTGGGKGPLAPVAPFADVASTPDGIGTDPVTMQALGMIGVPPRIFTAIGESLPGLGTGLPGIEAANALAVAAAEAETGQGGAAQGLGAIPAGGVTGPLAAALGPAAEFLGQDEGRADGYVDRVPVTATDDMHPGETGEGWHTPFGRTMEADIPTGMTPTADALGSAAVPTSRPRAAVRPNVPAASGLSGHAGSPHLPGLPGVPGGSGLGGATTAAGMPGVPSVARGASQHPLLPAVHAPGAGGLPQPGGPHPGQSAAAHPGDHPVHNPGQYGSALPQAGGTAGRPRVRVTQKA